MIRRLAALAIVISFAGCASFAEALGSKEVFVGCQVLDVATTVRALRLSSTAYEMNAIPLPALFVLKLALAVWVWRSNFWEETHPAPRIVINALACSPIPGNLKAAKGTNPG